MAHAALAALLGHLRRLGDPSAAAATDRELLRRYAASHNEAAFAVLLHRHVMRWSARRKHGQFSLRWRKELRPRQRRAMPFILRQPP
jgi:hypothetical protein